MPSSQDFLLFSPELALVATIVAVLLVPLVAGRNARISAAVALVGALVTLLLTGLGVAGRVIDGGYGGMSPPEATPMLIADNFAVVFKIFLMLFLALVIGLWLVGLSRTQKGRESSSPLSLAHGSEKTSAGPKDSRPFSDLVGGPEFFVLLLTSALGMALMVGTLNLLVIVIAIETASLPSYAIVASNRRSRLGAEASLKYVLFGGATAAIMVYGVSLLYGAFGTLDVPAIAAAMAENPGALGIIPLLGLAALTVGIAFKISAVPFHFWCPDVFEGAPIEVTTWLSVASKAAGLGLLLRVVHAFGSAPESAVALSPFLIGIGVMAALTCTVGNLSALRQDSVKRLLAYSSIAHAGYMMMAAAIFAHSPQMNAALAALVAYVFIYLLMNLGAFGVTAMVLWQTGSEKISAFTGLGRRSPALAIPMAVCLFSLVGLPPLGGFAAKWWLLLALGRAADMQPWLWGLVVVAVINTAISLYYYVRIIRQMFLTDDVRQPAFSAPLGGLAMVNACAVMLLLLGTVLIGPLGDQSRVYASNLFGTQPAAVAQPEPPPDLRADAN